MTQAFNLSQFANKVNTSGQADLTTAVSGTLPVANGGTGAATLTSGAVLVGAGTSAISSVAPSTSGNVLTSNGSAWVSSTPAGGATGTTTVMFYSSTSWAVPSGVDRVVVSAIGGGGGGASGPGLQAGAGGLIVASCTSVAGTLTITVGSGGAGGVSSGSSGGTSSVTGTGISVSATGGAGSGGSVGANGSGSVSTGTQLRAGSIATQSSQITVPLAYKSSVTASTNSSPVAFSQGLSTGAAGWGGFGSSATGGTGGVVIITY